jgi:hypothetical protein
MTDLTQLKPYKSLILSKAKGNVPLTPLVDAILDDLIDCLEIGATSTRQLISRQDAYKEGSMTIGIFHYHEERQASWTQETSILDHINHLAVICRQRRYVAIYLSESNRKYMVSSKIYQEGDSGLSALEIIPRGLLNAAFVQGPARTLWLSGTHRRTSIKADNKILSGYNLREALDPLGDQTFHFTAARCVPDDFSIRAPVGVSPRKSQVWLGPSRNWIEFLSTVSVMLSYIESTTTPTRTPLPIVAVSSTDATQISNPYDIALVPPELLADDPNVDVETQKEIELWGYQSSFEIMDAGEDYFVSQVSLQGQVLGEIRFDYQVAPPDQMFWEVSGLTIESDQEELFNRALQLTRRRGWLKIWFESGHTISSGEIYEVRHRDIPFTDLVWASLTGADESQKSYDVSKEKPKPIADIGNQDSLFDWMLHFWPNLDRSPLDPGCWLSSDDGAMEIADFIHLDDTVQPPVINLIHVKGSGNKNPGRGVSVSDYEVVTAQAVKNLRFLDRMLLAEGLEKGLGKKISKLVWHDRIQSTREDMIDALSKVSSNYLRRVYVFQPRLTRTMVEEARKNKKGSAYARLRQLDTLLLSGAASSKGLGVEFKVIGEDI